MDSKLTHEQYTLVPSEPTMKIDRKTTMSSSWSKEPQFFKKCKQYSKYGLVFSGITVIILMVVYGINNISLQSFTAQNSTLMDDHNMTDIINITVINLPTSTTQTTTTFHPRDIFNMLNPDGSSDHEPKEEENEVVDLTTEQEPKDVVISNKTVIIDGGNDSIIITNDF